MSGDPQADPVARNTGGDAFRDRLGRSLTYLRLSLTDRCNYRCVYCMPVTGRPDIPHGAILSYEELLRLSSLLAALGVRRYKITGGEPLCRKGAVSFIRDLGALGGVEEVTLTTNASLLEQYLDDLILAGVRKVNISLDALRPHVFSRISRSQTSPDTVIAAMRAARAAGMTVKINVVPLAGYNDQDLIPLARLALESGCHIRFIELMPVGTARKFSGIPQDSVEGRLRSHFGSLVPVTDDLGNGPAVYYAVPGLTERIGFISALEDSFCSSCNRIRLTSWGFLKTCLHHDAGVDLRALLRSGADDGSLVEAIRQAMADKPRAHDFAGGQSPSFYMYSVGG